MEKGEEKEMINLFSLIVIVALTLFVLALGAGIGSLLSNNRHDEIQVDTIKVREEEE